MERDNSEIEIVPSSISDDLRAELDRRLDEYLAAPDHVIPWDEVMASYNESKP